MKRFLSLPRITYTVRKQDIDSTDAVRLLLAVSSGGTPGQDSSHLAARQFAYWRQPQSPDHLDKMSRALDNSIAVAAAYTNVDIYQYYADSQGDAASAQPSTSGPGGSMGLPRAWLLPRPSTLPRSQQTLVGLARAMGDSSLTASLYDVAVHPSLQGFGIGRQLVHTLVRQLHSRGIYDISAIGPPELQSFFSRCYFSDDPLQSTFMAYTGALQGPGQDEEPMADMPAAGGVLPSGSAHGGSGQVYPLGPSPRQTDGHGVVGGHGMVAGCSGDGVVSGGSGARQVHLPGALGSGRGHSSALPAQAPQGWLGGVQLNSSSRSLQALLRQKLRDTLHEHRKVGSGDDEGKSCTASITYEI